jgi:hypothetical protein
MKVPFAGNTEYGHWYPMLRVAMAEPAARMLS